MGRLERELMRVVERGLEGRAQALQRLLDRVGREAAGKPIADVKVKLASAARHEGWTLTDPELTNFAEALSAGTRITVRTSSKR